jgi:hypothetical protein
MINDPSKHDEVERFGRVLCEISGGAAADSTAFSLISVGGIGMSVGGDSTTVGEDTVAMNTACKANVHKLELVVCLTENHKMLPQWWKDMNDKGEAGDCFRTVSIKFHNREGNLIRTVDFHDCWMQRLELCESDSNARNEFCVLRVTVNAGYTTGGLLS